MKNKFIVSILCVLLLGSSGLLFGQEEEGSAFDIKGVFLTDPEVMGVEIGWEPTLKTKELKEYLWTESGFQSLEIGKVKFKGLYPFDYHPEGKLEGEVDMQLNWMFELPTIPGLFMEIFKPTSDPLDKAIRYESMQGYFAIALGGESAENVVTENWGKTKIVGKISLQQELPLSFQLWSGLSWTGLMTNMTLNLLEEEDDEILPNERLDIKLWYPWIRQRITSDNNIGLFVYPLWEVLFHDGIEPFHYVSGEAGIYSKSLLNVFGETLGKITEPYAFYRYVKGKRAPSFINSEGYQIGIGTKIFLDKINE